MRAYEIRGSFGLDNLVLGERPPPEPGPRQVVVALRAASLNYRDYLMVRGLYNPKQKLPLVPLSDGCGVVARVGPGVTRVAVGDRVVPMFAQRFVSGRPTRDKLASTLGGPLDGTLAEEMLADEDAVAPAPAWMTDEEAATLPCAALTAWSALVAQGGLLPGQTVLVQGTGGVSIFALQIAAAIGARVIATSSSDEKLARVRALGAAETLNYKTTPDWGAAARKLTGGVGVDHVVDVGGADTFEEAARAVRPGGTISLIGNLTGGATKVNLVRIFMNNVRVQGIFVGSREAFEEMTAAMAVWKLAPVLDRVFPFADARAAFEHLGKGAHYGKVCVKIAD